MACLCGGVRRLDAYEAKVCFKLYRQRCFGRGHKRIDTVTSGFPSHELDQVKEAIARLVKDGILIEHPTKHGKAVHIDAAKRLDVWKALRKLPDYGWLPK